MNISNKNGGRLPAKSHSAKTIIEGAKREVSGFIEAYHKFKKQMLIVGYSSSTLFNYSCALA